MDLWHTITDTLDHYRYTILGVLIAVGMVFAGVSCQSQTASLVEPARQVTRPVFEAEAAAQGTSLTQRRIGLEAEVAKLNAAVEVFNSQAELGRGELDRQDAVRAELFDIAGGVVTQITTGQPTSASLVGTGITALGLLLGLGAAADSRRKDKVIEKVKNGTAATVTVTGTPA